MRTDFTLAQLADSEINDANTILRTCVHCGFCTATCPTYVLLGDELDSPRGRIYMIKNLLESGQPATAKVVKHIDRCLSCLSCMTTCPASVDYMHLVDRARVRIEKTFALPWPERVLRALLAFVLPSPGMFRLALKAAAHLLLHEHVGDLRMVRTWNAETNAHMVAVNDLLGYRPIERYGGFERRA